MKKYRMAIVPKKINAEGYSHSPSLFHIITFSPYSEHIPMAELHTMLNYGSRSTTS